MLKAKLPALVHGCLSRVVEPVPKLNDSTDALERPGLGKTPIYINNRNIASHYELIITIQRPNKFVILDADSIRDESPEYKDRNANHLYEEPNGIFKQMIDWKAGYIPRPSGR
jgi:hypothetical protein